MNYDPKGPTPYIRHISSQWWIMQNREFELSGWPMNGPFATRAKAEAVYREIYGPKPLVR